MNERLKVRRRVLPPMTKENFERFEGCSTELGLRQQIAKFYKKDTPFNDQPEPEILHQEDDYEEGEISPEVEESIVREIDRLNNEDPRWPRINLD